MTLIVSVRSLDGIVIAGDSLATYMTSPQVQGDVTVTCPQCTHQHVIQAQLQGAALPATTLSFAQKVFPFMQSYGVGTYGLGQLSGKTIYFAIRELEKELIDAGESPRTATEAAELIADHTLQLLTDQARREGFDLGAQPDQWVPLGFHIDGYDNDVPTTIVVGIGKTRTLAPFVGLDANVNGQVEVVNALFELYHADPQNAPLIDQFSLQDAIAYAEFLIDTTASHQQFSRKIPGVGGDIDIGLVTPFDGFSWIKQKPLYGKTREET